MEEQRKRLHDTRQLLNHMSSIVQNSGRDELLDYIGQTLDHIHVTDERFCADSRMNGILQYYAAAARILANFAKDHDFFEIKSGFMDGEVVELSVIDQLAKLPTRDVLLANVLGAFQAPIAAFARVMQAVVDEGGFEECLKKMAPAEEAPAEETAEAEAPAEEKAEAPAEEAPAAEEAKEEAPAE